MRRRRKTDLFTTITYVSFGVAVTLWVLFWCSNLVDYLAMVN